MKARPPHRFPRQARSLLEKSQELKSMAVDIITLQEVVDPRLFEDGALKTFVVFMVQAVWRCDSGFLKSVPNSSLLPPEQKVQKDAYDEWFRPSCLPSRLSRCFSASRLFGGLSCWRRATKVSFSRRSGTALGGLAGCRKQQNAICCAAGSNLPPR